MKHEPALVAAVALASLSLAPLAWGQEAAASAPAVTAESLEPVVVLGDSAHNFWANYRAIYAGLREVQKQQADLAPEANFGFLVARPSSDDKPSDKRIRVVLVGAHGETEVSRDGATPFRFPLDPALAKEGVDIAISGAGPAPMLRIAVWSPGDASLKWRLGDARLICAFLTAARKEASSGMNWLTLSVLGKYTCDLPMDVSPQVFQVFITRKDGKEVALAPKDGRYYFPAHISSYPNDAILSARPR